MGRYVEKDGWGAQNLVELVRKLRTALGWANAAVRYDSGQSLDATQKATARSNIAAAGDAAATSGTSGLMSAEDKTKLDGIASGANAYVLPAATSSSLGGVIVGSGIAVDGGGTISVGSEYVTSAVASSIAGAVAEDVLSDGGYVTSSGASAIVSQYVSSGGYVTSSAVSDVVDSAVSAGGYVTSSGVADVVSAQISSGGYVTSAGASAAAAAVISSGGYVTSSYVASSTVASAASAGVAAKVGASTVGGASQPVYVSSGTVVSCTYSLGKSVPANAVFTDTTYSAGTAALISSGTDTTERVWQPKILSAYVAGATVTSAASAGSAANASSLGGVSAGGYMRTSGGTFSGTQKITGTGTLGLSITNTSANRTIDMRSQDNNNAGIWDTENSRWMIRANSGGKTAIQGGSGTGRYDIFIEDVASMASGSVQKTVNIQRGSASLFTSGTTVNAGYVTSKTVTFGSAFGASTPHVMAIVRGGTSSYAPGMNAAVHARTASNCTIAVRSTYTSSVTTGAASYIDWVAFYF